jgi:hypothetical protein
MVYRAVTLVAIPSTTSDSSSTSSFVGQGLVGCLPGILPSPLNISSLLYVTTRWWNFASCVRANPGTQVWICRRLEVISRLPLRCRLGGASSLQNSSLVQFNDLVSLTFPPPLPRRFDVRCPSLFLALVIACSLRVPLETCALLAATALGRTFAFPHVWWIRC